MTSTDFPMPAASVAGCSLTLERNCLMLDYLKRIPDHIPSGKIVVHNQVYPVSRQCGTRGSRFWLADTGDPLYELCSCDWAPELGEHYRVPTGSQETP
jgi:hypothetical protein